MNVLITGGCGYIGSAVQNYLTKTQKHFVVDTIDLEWFGNFNNKQNIKQDFSTLSRKQISKYDVIFHTGSNSSVPLCKDIHDSFDNNVIKFLDFTKKLSQEQKFIYASSSCVYVTGDEEKTEEEINFPIDGLTLSKQTIDFISPLLGIQYYGMRFGSVNGWSPNMRTDLMINSMTISSKKNGKIEVYNKDAHRPIVSTFDICRAVLKIIESDQDNRGIYNLASFNLKIGEIADKVSKIVNVPVVDCGNPGTYDFKISSEKFKNKFNYQFESTVESIVSSILDNDINPNWGRRDDKWHTS